MANILKHKPEDVFFTLTPQLDSGLRAAAEACQTRTAYRIRLQQASDDDTEERYVSKVAEGRGGSRRRKKGDDKVGGGGKACSFCKKKGHSSDDCYFQRQQETALGRSPTDKDKEEALQSFEGYVTRKKKNGERWLPIATQSHNHTITSEFCFKYTRRFINLLMTSGTPNVSHKFQYVSYQTFHSITPGSIHLLQKKSNV